MRLLPAFSALPRLFTGCSPQDAGGTDSGETTRATGDSTSGAATETTGEAARPPVRVFAVGNHHGLDYVGSYADFTAEMRRLMDALAPDLASDHPNLVVFGEDVGLPAAFLGPRGAAAREASGALEAFLTVAQSYQPIVDHYVAAHPDIGYSRAISLALTDTMARAFFDTFPALAREYGVYLSACTLLPRVVVSEDPADIDFFGDPEVADATFVYLPAGANVYNVCYLWDDQGEEIGSSRKANLVALEGPEMLDLTPEELGDVVAYDLPFGKVAIAISLDAFVPAYVRHIHDQGAQIVLQNDANPGQWAITQPMGAHLGPSDGSPVWQPEEWRDSTIRMVEHPDYPGIQYNVCPMIVGNLFDLIFDGQSSITARRPPEGLTEQAYIGDAPQGRFLALAPWVVPDPGDADPSLSLAARRGALSEVAGRLAPGSGDDLENMYRENIVWADLQVED